MIEIQWLEAKNGRWLKERRFGDHLAHTCPVSYIDLVWDQILTTCPGCSWRMVQLVPGADGIILHGPTTAVAGAPKAPFPVLPTLYGGFSSLRFDDPAPP